jgi:hypothetical protein
MQAWRSQLGSGSGRIHVKSLEPVAQEIAVLGGIDLSESQIVLRRYQIPILLVP